MGYDKNYKDVSDIDLKEFKKLLENNGIDEKFTNKHQDDSTSNQPKKKSMSKTLLKGFDNWCIKNPGLSLAVVLGGSVFIYYKLTIRILSQAVFKGNLKTSRYFDKHSG